MNNSVRTVKPLYKRESFQFFAYISPWLVGFLVFMLGPLIYSLLISFTDTKFGTSWNFVGLKNYKFMFTEDPLFYKSLINTLYYTLVSVPLGLVLAFFLAVLLNMKLKGMGIFRTIFYLPSIISGVAVVMLWGWIFNPSFGLLNYFLSTIGIQGPNWLGDPNWAMPAIIFMSLWNIGGSMVIFLASLQDIPQDLYESASIDGAGSWTKTVRITIPLVSPVIFFNLIMGIIGGFQIFNQPYILTKGGPLDSTYVYTLHLFLNAFHYSNMSYASALAWILFLIILFLTSIVLLTSKKWVYYGGDRS
jgi:multiple sugar transport system permease protein